MEDLSYSASFFINLVKVIIKSVAGGIGFSIIGLEAKKAWKKEQKWKLALAFGAIIFGVYILFVEI